MADQELVTARELDQELAERPTPAEGLESGIELGRRHATASVLFKRIARTVLNSKIHETAIRSKEAGTPAVDFRFYLVGCHHELLLALSSQSFYLTRSPPQACLAHAASVRSNSNVSPRRERAFHGIAAEHGQWRLVELGLNQLPVLQEHFLHRAEKANLVRVIVMDGEF
jgi:hypothetical protein